MGGGSTGSCSDRSLRPWSIRGTLEEVVFLGRDFRPLYCIRNSSSKALLKGNARYSAGSPPGQGNLRHLFMDKHVAVISTAEGHRGNLLPNGRAHKARGLQMSHLPSSLKHGQSHCFPCNPWPSPEINTALSKWSLLLAAPQENSSQSVQKYPPPPIVRLNSRAA